MPRARKEGAKAPKPKLVPLTPEELEAAAAASEQNADSHTEEFQADEGGPAVIGALPKKPAEQPAEVAAGPVIPDEPDRFPKLANPVPGDDGEALVRIHNYFIAKWPAEYENIRLCPLQHGIPAMADILRGRG